VERRTALESITRRLLEVEVMDATELKRIMDATIPGLRVKPGTIVPPRETAEDASSGKDDSIEPDTTSASSTA
jgi:cell division protease FtsH